nr:MAG TPA: minor tail protein [Caudoviricetes sp.]
MAKDTDGLLLTASLDISKTVENIKENIKKLNTILASDNSARVKIVGGLNLNKTQSLIQSQMATISKNLKLNIGQIDTSSLNTALSNVQNKVIGTNNGLTIKPTVDGKVIEDTDVLIKAVVGKLQQLNNVDLNGFKNNLKNLGFSGKDVTSAADELVQSLKLTPENKSVIIDSYQNLMDSIRNTIKSDSMVADKNFDNRLVMSIYQAISEYKNLGQTVTSVMTTVKNATETVVNTNTQVNNSAKYISTEYQTSFGAVSNVLQQARAEFERFGEVSVVSNKSVKAFEGVPEHFKNFTIQVKSATGEVQKFFYTFENTGDKQNPVFQYMLQNINEADAGVKKLADDIAKAKAEYTSKLAGFESTNSQIKSGLSAEIANVVNEINKLGTSDGSIQNLKVAFDGLNTSANKVKENLKATGASLNPVDNAINRYKEMDNTIQDISNKFNQLKVVPNNATAQIEGLKGKLVELRNIESSEGRTENWSHKYRELAIAVKEAETNVKKLQLAEKSDNSSAQQQSTYYSRIFENQKLIYNLKKQLLTANKETTVELNRQITNAQKRISYGEEQLKKKQLESNELIRQKNELENIYSAELKIANLSTKGNMLSGIDKTITKLQSIPNQTAFLNNSQNGGVKQLQADIQNIINKYNELRTKIQSLNGNDTNTTSNLRQQMLSLATEFDRVNTSAKNLKASMSSDNSMQRQAQQAELLIEKVKKLRSEIVSYQNANTKAMKSNRTGSNGITYSAEIDAMLAKLKTASSVTDAEFKKISASFRSLKAEIKSVGLEGGTILSNLWTNIKKFSNWMGITMVTASIAREIRGMFTDVAELDEALIDLRKTFGGTAEDLQKFYYESNNIAKQLGITTKEVIEQASAWSRLGYNTTEAVTSLSKTSSIFAAISPEMDVDTATNTLVSVLKAYEKYGLTAEDALDGIASKVNEIGNNFAVSNSDIAEALQRSSASMASANTDLDHTIALITAGNEIAQNPESVGNALKTISMRIRGMNEETEELDGTLQTISGDVYELTHGQVSIMQDADTYKDIYTILDEISQIWDSLTDKEQATLTEKLFGKQRGNIGSAIISNFEQARKAVDTMANSEGGAMREMEVIMDSVSYKANELKETVVGIAQDSITQDFLKSVLESATRILNTLSDSSSPIKVILTQIANLLELVTKLTDKMGLIPTILAGLSLKNVGELSLKYARFRITTDIRCGECNTF